MTTLVYVICGVVFFLLMLGIMASHQSKVKRVDGTLVAAALAFLIGLFFIVFVGVQNNYISELKDNLKEVQAALPSGLPSSELELALPTMTPGGGVEVTTTPFPAIGVVAFLFGLLAMALGAVASRRGDRAAGQTLMVLGIFLIVVAVVVFSVLS